MRSRKNQDYTCFGCVHVRNASTALFTGHLVMNFLAICLLAYLAAVWHKEYQMNAAGPTKKDKSYVQDIVELEYDNKNDDKEPVILDTAVININITHFTSVFVIKQDETSHLSRSELIVAILFATISAVAALVALIGVVKRSAALIVPFLVGHILDILFSIVFIAGVDLYGFDFPKLRKRSEAKAAKDSADSWYLDMQAWSVVAAILLIMAKVYFARVLWLTYVHLKEEKSRLVREQRQQKWMNGLIEGAVTYENEEIAEVSSPPPTYEEMRLDEPEPPRYAATYTA